MWGFIIFCMVLFCSFIGVAMFAENLTCSAKASKMGFEKSYGPFQGCMIKVKDRWVPIEKYRVAED